MKNQLTQQVIDAMRQQGGVTVMFHTAIADHLGLGPTDHKCLDLLVMHGPMTAGGMAARTGLTSGAITGVIDRLERDGFVSRVADPADRRRVIVYPNHEFAMDRLAPVFSRVEASGRRMLERYNEDELRLILDFVARGSRMLEEHIRMLRDERSAQAGRGRASSAGDGTKVQ